MSSQHHPCVCSSGGSVRDLRPRELGQAACAIRKCRKRTSKSSTSFSALRMVTMAAPDSARCSCLEPKPFSLSLPDSLPHVHRLPFGAPRDSCTQRSVVTTRTSQPGSERKALQPHRTNRGFTPKTPSSFASRHPLFMHEPQGAAMYSRSAADRGQALLISTARTFQTSPGRPACTSCPCTGLGTHQTAPIARLPAAAGQLPPHPVSPLG